MTGKRNYQRELETILDGLAQGEGRPTLLLHVCCAPCSSYVLEYLHRHFRILLCFYNPNITEKAEHEHRESELKRFVKEFPAASAAEFVTVPYEPERFFAAVQGLEQEPEGGARCEVCFELRLREAAHMAKVCRADWFATTLTISPQKDADRINRIGEKIAEETGVAYLPSDFKKRDGYRRSVELSKEYELYRQDTCGCMFSKREEVK